MKDVEITREPIELHKLLKFEGLAASGGEAKAMIAAGRGSIVNIASTAGITGIPRAPAYCASKSGIILLTKSLALEWARHNIRVNAVAPGAVDTDMLRQAAPHLRTRTGPADVAKIIAFLCDSAESGCMTGATLAINSNL